MADVLDAELLEPLKKLTRDLKTAAQTLTPDEARYLVDAYYSMQEDRKRSDNQVRALREGQEPHEVIGWLASNTRRLENHIKAALDAYTDAQPVGQWAKSITGIGPVISAGLLAHIDITRSPYLGHLWRFAGLDPSRSWIGREKSKEMLTPYRDTIKSDNDGAIMGMLAAIAKDLNIKPESLLAWATTDREGKPCKLTHDTLARAMARRPWNASLKVLCWKIGESFVKTSGLDSDFYGKLYLQRKQRETFKNEAGEFAPQAAGALLAKSYRADTTAKKCYLEGKLPPAHIHARAKRWAVKLFLAHYWEVAYTLHYDRTPPKPYVLSVLHHGRDIIAPNLPPAVQVARVKAGLAI